MIETESDYLLICVCNIRVPRWSSQSSQPGPLGAAVIWVIKIITIIKEIVCCFLWTVSKSLKVREKTYSKSAHSLNNKNQKTSLFTSLVLFWHFVEKSCKHLPPLKMHWKKCTFSCLISILNPASAVYHYASSTKSLYSKILASYTIMCLIYILFECEQKGKDLSMGEHDLDCKWFNKWIVILLRLRFCVCHFHSILRRFHLIKCSWLAINTVKD